MAYDPDPSAAGAVERQVRSDVDALGELMSPVAESLAEVAYSLARRLEDPEERSPAAVAKELRLTLTELASTAIDPEDGLGDELSEPV